MARPLTSAEREELASNAYELSLKGWSHRRIARELGSTHKTIASVIQEEKQNRRFLRKDTAASLLDSIDQGISETWRRLEALPSTSASPVAAGLLNNLNSLVRTKMDIVGLKAPTRSESKLTHQYQKLDLSKLSEQELKDYVAMLERIEALQEGAESGELSRNGQNGVPLREISGMRDGVRGGARA
jgi:hypothetical protein